MRRGLVIFLVLLIVGWLVYRSLANKTQTPKSETAGASTPSTPTETPETAGMAEQPGSSLGDPRDYFPFTPGYQMEYRITLGNKEPLNFQVIHWPMGGDGGMVTESRGRFIPPAQKEEYSLVLQVVGPVTQEGPYHWDGVEIRVVKDELGIFDDVEHLFWMRTQGDDLNILEVRMYSPESPGAPTGSWGVPLSTGGNASKALFFAGRPGTGISLGDNGSKGPDDLLAFLGSKNGVLCFMRKVAEHKDDTSSDLDGSEVFNRPFEEYTWFEKGRGMVRLEQRVDGVTSMTWQLVGADVPQDPAGWPFVEQ